MAIILKWNIVVLYQLLWHVADGEEIALDKAAVNDVLQEAYLTVQFPFITAK